MILWFIRYNGKFPGVATMVNEEAWPAGVKIGLIPWELPFNFFSYDVGPKITLFGTAS